MQRSIPLVTGQYYHVFSRAVGDLTLFKTQRDYARMMYLIRYYRMADVPERFSYFFNSELVKIQGLERSLQLLDESQDKHVNIVAYCLMPNHLHFVLYQLKDDGITKFMGNILNGFARYFNIKSKRKGAVWINKFKNVLVDSNEQFLHLTRYIHLNPVTAGVSVRPEQWIYSSYSEYLRQRVEAPLCHYQDLIDLSSEEYKRFVEDRINYQRQLGLIKHVLLEE